MLLTWALDKSPTKVSSRARNSCWANSCGKGRRSKAILIIRQGFKMGQTSKTPRTKQAKFWAISLWHKRCLGVGQGKRLMREHKSANWGFKFSQRASISASVFKDFKPLNWKEIENKCCKGKILNNFVFLLPFHLYQ